jgi:hypothetical protein
VETDARRFGGEAMLATKTGEPPLGRVKAVARRTMNPPVVATLDARRALRRCAWITAESRAVHARTRIAGNAANRRSELLPSPLGESRDRITVFAEQPVTFIEIDARQPAHEGRHA